MTKKLSDKDKKDWKIFTESNRKLENKDKVYFKIKQPNIKKKIDLHGYTLDDANLKIVEFIENCYSSGVQKINVITGKGSRSNNLNDPYQSKKLSILKYSVPNFIENNSELMKKILKIDFDSVNNPLVGNFNIILKKKNEIK